MKVLITGSTGFLGSHLVSYLGERRVQVGVLIRSTSNKNDFRDCVIHTWDSDIGRTSSQIRAANYDFIVHAATKYSFIDDPELFSEMIDASITLSLALNRACLDSKTKLITIGSFFESSAEGEPANVYALLKKLQHEILAFAKIETYKILVGDMYGPNDKRGKLLSQLINMTVSRQQIDLKNPSGKVCPVHVHDVLKSIYQTIISEEKILTQEIIGPDGTLTVMELKDLVAEVFDNHEIFGTEIHPPKSIFDLNRIDLRSGIIELIEEAI
jgi:nucleoside-diphosphate-sugar epimerase